MRAFSLLLLLALPFPIAAQTVSEIQGTASLEGEVIDPQGNPLPGAEVWVQTYNCCPPALLPGAVSGADGRFVIEGLAEDQPLRLFACLPGHVPARLSLKNPLERPVLPMPQPAVRISGRVRDPRGKPVAGAAVSVTGQGISFESPDSYIHHPCQDRFSALSEKNGSFSLEVPPANWSVEARAQDYVSTRLERLPRAPDQNLEGLEIVLTPGSIVAGRVLDAEGRPVAGAQVTWGPVQQALSDKDGLYEVRGVASGRQTLVVSDPAHEPALRDVQVSPGRSRADLLLGSKRRHIRGRVLDLDGAPIAGARFEGVTGATLEDGSFSLWISKGAAWDIHVEKEGYFPVEPVPRVEAGDEPVEELEVRMRRGVSVTGRVLGLRPQELAQLRIQGSSTGKRGCDRVRLSGEPLGNLDEAQGLYRIDGLDASSSKGIWVRALLETRCVERNLILEPGEEEAVLDFEFPPVFPVRGRVLNAENEPLAGVWIGLGHGDSAPAAEAWTRPDGSFLLEAERGTYDLQASHEAYVLTQKQRVTVTETPAGNLKVQLVPRGRIRGRLLGPAGVVTVKGPQPAKVQTRTAREGITYLITGLVPGEWNVTASAYGRIIRQRVVLRSEEEEIFQDLDLHFGPLTLSGRLLDGGKPVYEPVALSSDDGFFYYARPEGDGTFRFEDLREGTYQLQLGRAGEEDKMIPVRKVQLSADRDLVIDLANKER